MNKNKAIQIGAVALASAVLCGALVYYNFIDKEDASGAILYEECPDFTLQTYAVENGKFVVSDEEFTLSEHRGKVVVLNFWADYCEPCRKEIPHFNELYEAYEGEVEVVIINGETQVDAQGLLDKYINNVEAKYYEEYYSKWPEFTCTFARYEKDNDVKELFEVGDALPITVIVDKEGVIKYIAESSLSFTELEEAVKKEL
ncbi:MAG: TlpA family protein disulfide reductase [Clostridia bacterium]|nr:TlpA family protein disulfide reductase [Clostridia bacterium]